MTISGIDLGRFVLGLCGHAATRKYGQDIEFSDEDMRRFIFCAIFHNTASAIWWINRAAYAQSSSPPQAFLDDFLDSINKLLAEAGPAGMIQNVSSVIKNQLELTLLDAEHNIAASTGTTINTLFFIFYERRVDRFFKAFDQSLAFARRARSDTTFFALDPVAKVFLDYFAGSWESAVSIMPVITSFLSTSDQAIAQYLYDSGLIAA